MSDAAEGRASGAEESAPESAQASSLGPASGFEEGAVYCDVCRIWLNGQTQWEDHKIGKMHRKLHRTFSRAARVKLEAPAMELRHLHDACKDLSRLDQASFHLEELPLALTRRFLASCVPPCRANKVLRRAWWRSELWESIAVLASGSRSGRRIAFLLANWVGRLPPQPKPQSLASGSSAEQPKP